MATNTSRTLASLLLEALSMLYRATERPLQVTVGTDALTLTTDTTLTLATATEWNAVQVSDLLENGQELLLVTDKSVATVPIFTVSRGYAGTPAAAAAAGTVLLKQPEWPRFEVRRAVLRSLRGPLATGLPLVKSTSLTPVTDQYYVLAPSDTVTVHRVSIVPTGPLVTSTPFRHWVDLSQWEFIDDVPTSVSRTGKILTIPNGIYSTDTLHLVYEAPYTWSRGGALPVETETVDLPFGGEDLPALYAAAYLLGNRELSRLELDKAEEWNHEAAARNGVNIQLVRMAWQEFYRRLDEARRKQNVPRHRPYKKMQTSSRGRWYRPSWRI